MSLAREVNEKLDEILALREEIKHLDEHEAADAILVNPETGDKLTKEEALKCAEGVVDKLKDSLNTLTNKGQNIRDIFTNQFYINDMTQDKIISEQMKTSLDKS